MARNLQVYPKASIEGSTWTYLTKIYESATGIQSRFTEVIAAGVTAEQPLRLLKVVWDVTVADTDTDQDVADSLFVDDITPAPSVRVVQTVWSEWQDRAEGIIRGLTTGYTKEDFWSAWTMGDTQAFRNNVNRAMVSGPGGIGRGWTIMAGTIHQHEGDGTVTEG